VNPTTSALRQVSLPVADLDRALGFYTGALGLRLIARFGNLAFCDLDGVRLLLEQGSQQSTGSILYFAVADIATAHQQLVGHGVEFVDEPHVIFVDVDGTFGTAGLAEWMAFFRDTEGNLLAISSRQQP
jgi:catechol 2,3-dioxygenase-like lactoylglutathione lyase family enzyme